MIADLALDAERLLKWAGVALVVLASGFAVSSAHQRGWFGVEAQLAAAVGLGAALVGAGHHMRMRRPAWTAALTAGGIGVWFFTFSSELFTGLVSEPAGLAAVGLVSAIGWALAVARRSESIGAAALIGSLAGAVEVDLLDLPPLVVMTWGLIATLTAVALADWRRWKWLRPGGLILAMAWMVPPMAWAEAPTERVVLAVGAVVIAALWHVVPSRGDVTGTGRLIEMQASSLVVPWLIALSGLGLDFETTRAFGVVHVAIGLGVGGLAWSLRSRLLAAHVGALLIGGSVGTSIGLVNLLDADAVALGFAAQAIGLAALARYEGSRRFDLNSIVVWVLAAVLHSAVVLTAWTEQMSWGTAAAQLLAFGTLIATVVVHRWGQVRRVGAAVGLLLGLNLAGATLIHLPQGLALVSLAWAVIGVSLLVAGILRQEPATLWVGMATLALTVVKLMTVDLDEVDTLWRAALFFVIGVGFLRLGATLPRLVRPTDQDQPSASADPFAPDSVGGPPQPSASADPFAPDSVGGPPQPSASAAANSAMRSPS